MKILLVSPATGAWSGISKNYIFNGKTFRFSMLSLLTIAQISPQDAQIRIIDEQIDNLPYEEDFDIVGITFMTAVATRAYEIASVFRKRKIPVVLGGFHTTLNPEEALQHADAIVIGNAFGAWEALIEDFKAGRLKRKYFGNADGKVPIYLPRHLIKKSNYSTINATYATMGCTNRCHFCSITAFHNARQHQRNIDDVINEISSFKGSFFMFVDDNLTQDRDYIHTLLERMVPLKKKWITQASLDIACDEKMLQLLRKAGCIGLFIGLETFSTSSLQDQEKFCNSPEKYKEAIARIHKYGIFVEAGIIFGFDADKPDVFQTTLKMLDNIDIDAIQVSILTPVPGTPLHKKMRERIFDTNWEHYDFRHVVFYPGQMNTEQLQAGTDWVIRKFYSPMRIFKRALRWITMTGGVKNTIYPLVLNLAYFGRVKVFAIRGHDPAHERKDSEKWLLLVKKAHT
jgi:radical SAM superfamily enzyme YgiQ (UPF0313 family)